jgi:hypothetical protein
MKLVLAGLQNNLVTKISFLLMEYVEPVKIKLN